MAKNHKGSFLTSDTAQSVWLVCAQGWGCCSTVIRGLDPPIHSLRSPVRPWSSAALREQKMLAARPGSSTYHFQPHFTIQNSVTWMHLISGECGKYNPMYAQKQMELVWEQLPYLIRALPHFLHFISRYFILLVFS